MMCQMCQNRGMGFILFFLSLKENEREVKSWFLFLSLLFFLFRRGKEMRKGNSKFSFFLSFSLPPRKKKEEENGRRKRHFRITSFFHFPCTKKAGRNIRISICFLSSFFFEKKLKRILFLFSFCLGRRGKERKWNWSFRLFIFFSFCPR